MRITQVNIMDRAAGRPQAATGIAEAEVELDGVMAVRGIGIHRGPLGYFVTFPVQGRRKLVESLRPSFARTLRESVLTAFFRHVAESTALPIDREMAHVGGVA